MTTVTSPTPTMGIPPHPVSSIHAGSEPQTRDLPNTPAPTAAPTLRTTTPGAIEAALRAIISEVTPGYRPFFSSDSYLPAHLVDAARAALAGNSTEAHQQAHNALSTAAWHIARGEAPQALARLRRARSHITASMEAPATPKQAGDCMEAAHV